jgi:hypothetical protein
MADSKLQTLDMLFAFKAVSLSGELSGTEKRVCSAVIDSYNRATTQCDPSLNRIARLLAISRRTVIRAFHKIERQRFIVKIRHGGHSHRNSYSPNWALFRDLEANWRDRKNASRLKSSTTKLSPCQAQGCHLGGGQDDTQTSLIKQSNKPAAHNRNGDSGNSDVDAQARKAKKLTAVTRSESNQSRPPVRPRDAALAAAERRWNTALHEHFSSTPEVYGQVIGALDQEMISAATAAEMRKHGAGIAYILEQLRVQGLEEQSRIA